ALPRLPPGGDPALCSLGERARARDRGERGWARGSGRGHLRCGVVAGRGGGRSLAGAAPPHLRRHRPPAGERPAQHGAARARAGDDPLQPALAPCRLHAGGRRARISLSPGAGDRHRLRVARRADVAQAVGGRRGGRGPRRRALLHRADLPLQADTAVSHARVPALRGDRRDPRARGRGAVGL
ncbi:MAG: hypothetical protein AVDCRST_MAG45-2630, partial [uncultured Solirubrobacterales bacterium]